MSIGKKVRELAKKRRALILAHHYQVDDVKDLADYIGDSYGLAQTASRSDAEVVVLCGVRFMAETVAILSPGKTVLLPEPLAGCPLADTINPAQMASLRRKHPGVPIVAYVNTTAAVKALSDYACTSANAVAVVGAVPGEEVIFLPDRNLADFVGRKTGKKIIAWPGSCPIHHQITAADVTKAKERHPGAVFIAHPECRAEVLDLAQEVASTSGLIRYVAASSAGSFIIGTEEGVLGELRRSHPDKEFFGFERAMVCPNMKLTVAEDVLAALENMQHRVTVETDIAALAARSLAKMMEISG